MDEKAKRGGVQTLEVNADVASMGVIVEFILDRLKAGITSGETERAVQAK